MSYSCSRCDSYMTDDNAEPRCECDEYEDALKEKLATVMAAKEEACDLLDSANISPPVKPDPYFPPVATLDADALLAAARQYYDNRIVSLRVERIAKLRAVGKDPNGK